MILQGRAKREGKGLFLDRRHVDSAPAAKEHVAFLERYGWRFEWAEVISDAGQVTARYDGRIWSRRGAP